jgi:hypothetical protein
MFRCAATQSMWHPSFTRGSSGPSASTGCRRPAQGLILLPPDPPEWEEMSFEVAQRLRAQTARLDDLNQCWMAEAPEAVAPVLQRFWSSLA